MVNSTVPYSIVKYVMAGEQRKSKGEREDMLHGMAVGVID